MDLGDKQLNLSQQSALAGMKLWAHLHWYRHSQQTRECHHFYFATRLSLECCAWFGVAQFVKDLLDWHTWSKSNRAQSRCSVLEHTHYERLRQPVSSAWKSAMDLSYEKRNTNQTQGKKKTRWWCSQRTTGTGSCEISLLGDVQIWRGQDPEQPNLTSVGPAFKRELDLMASKSSNFCYSVILTEAQRQEITWILPVVLIMLTLSFKISISGLFIPFPNCWGIPTWY